jgi:hypothetical protein
VAKMTCIGPAASSTADASERMDVHRPSYVLNCGRKWGDGRTSAELRPQLRTQVGGWTNIGRVTSSIADASGGMDEHRPSYVLELCGSSVRAIEMVRRLLLPMRLSVARLALHDPCLHRPRQQGDGLRPRPPGAVRLPVRGRCPGVSGGQMAVRRSRGDPFGSNRRRVAQTRGLAASRRVSVLA